MKLKIRDKGIKELREQLCDMKWIRIFSAFAMLNILILIFLLSESWIISTAAPVMMKPQQHKSLYMRTEYSYLDVRQISDWVYDYVPASYKMRPNASFFLEIVDTADRRFIVQITKNYAARNQAVLEGLKCANTLAPYRIYGCAEPISNSVVDGIVELDYNLQSRDDYRTKYGYAVLRLQDSPEADIALPTVGILIWAGVTVALYRIMTRGFYLSLQWAENHGKTNEVMHDWKAASAEYKKRGFYLGQKYMFVKNGGFFFAYNEIAHVEPGANKQYSRRVEHWKWPSLLVIDLKTGRKLFVGTCDNPRTDQLLRQKVIAHIRSSMNEQCD